METATVTSVEVLDKLKACEGKKSRWVSYHLSKGDSAWNPASTKLLIYGPARVEYVRHEDGGITAIVEKREELS